MKQHLLHTHDDRLAGDQHARSVHSQHQRVTRTHRGTSQRGPIQSIDRTDAQSLGITCERHRATTRIVGEAPVLDRYSGVRDGRLGAVEWNLPRRRLPRLVSR